MRIQDNQVVGVSYLVIEDRRYWGYVKMEQKKGDNIWFVANAYKEPYHFLKIATYEDGMRDSCVLHFFHQSFSNIGL
jgi:hypothetical protein